MIKKIIVLTLLMGQSLMANENLAKPGFINDNNLPLANSILGNSGEGFDDTSNLPNWIMDNQSNPVGSNGWFQGTPDTFNAHSGNNDSYIGANFNSTGGTDICNYLILPDLGYVQTLSFWTRTTLNSNFPDRLLLLHSPSGGTNTGDCFNGFGDFSHTLTEINPNLDTGGYPEEWTQFTSQIDATGRVALVYYVADGGLSGTNSNYIGIDTVEWLAGYPDADLSIVKSNNAQAGIITGDNVTFTLNINNSGPGDGANTTIVDTLPSSLSYVSNTCGGSYNAGTLTWTIDSFANASSDSCDIVATVVNSGVISNTATISADEIDNNSSNNSSTTQFSAGVPTADLELSINNYAKGTLNYNDQVIFTQILINNGPQQANNITVTGSIPNELNFVSSSCSIVENGSMLTWNVGSLANAIYKNCNVEFVVSGYGRIDYQASANADEFDNVDSNNNAVSSINGPVRIIPSLNLYGLLILSVLMLILGARFRKLSFNKSNFQ